MGDRKIFSLRTNKKSVGPWLLGLILPLSALSATPDKPLSQTKAQEVAENLNRQASDQSLESSTTSAMKALMHFSSGEMPSAVSNGMTAYGKYRNSENLDHLGNKNVLNAVSMGSIGANGPSSAVSGQAVTSTSFRRLDPSFLRKGEAGAIAAEFEKKSGMKREDFLRELTAVSEKKISRSDPQLMDKVLSRFESFASRIPNAEFRAKVEAGVKRVPDTVRNGLVGKAIVKFTGLVSSGAEPSAPESNVATSPTPTPATTPPAAPVAPAPSAPSSVVSTPAPAPSATARPSIGKPATLDPLNDVINASISTQSQEPSIFEQVRQRYRSLTPFLTPKN